MTSAKPLRLLDLFSGIGRFSFAAETIVGGFTTSQDSSHDAPTHRGAA